MHSSRAGIMAELNIEKTMCLVRARGADESSSSSDAVFASGGKDVECFEPMGISDSLIEDWVIESAINESDM